MAYVPPDGNKIHLRLGEAGYAPPNGDSIPLNLVEGEPAAEPYQFTGLLAASAMPWGMAATSDRADRNRWGRAQPVAAGSIVATRQGAASDTGTVLSWGATEPLDVQVGVAWGDLESLDVQRSLTWGATDPLDVQVGLAWGDLESLDVQVTVDWGGVSPVDTGLALPWGDGTPVNREERFSNGRGDRRDGAHGIPWDEGRLPGPGESQPPVIPEDPPAHVCYAPPPGNDIRLSLARPAAPPDGNAIHLNLLCAAETRYYYLGRTTVTTHSVFVERLDDDEPVPTLGGSASFDVASWAWDFNLTFRDRAAMLLVMPTSDGAVPFRVNIDGHVLTGLVEDAGEDRRHSQGTRFSGGGRSKTALLDDPYQPSRSYVSTAAKTASQLAEDEVTAAGLQATFGIDWQAANWTVPIGAYTYDRRTPMGGILRLASAIGALVQPQVGLDSDDPTDDILVVDGYRDSSGNYPWPWQWDQATPEVVLDGGSLMRIGNQMRPGPGYIGVYVSGDTSGGVLGNVKRDNTNGVPYGELIVDRLMTDVLPVRRRGGSFIADAEDVMLVSVLLPVLPYPNPPGIVLPGTLVQVLDPVYGSFMTRCESVSIRWGRPSADKPVQVRQSLVLSRHYPFDPAA